MTNITEPVNLPLPTILNIAVPGSQPQPWTWDDEHEEITNRDAKGLSRLMKSLLSAGMKEPIVIGHDGRVWDGHHRIVAMAALTVAAKRALLVPTVFVWSVEPDDFDAAGLLLNDA